MKKGYKQRDRENPREKKVMLRFNDDELSLVNEWAERSGKTRAELIREIVMMKASLVNVPENINQTAA